MRLRTMLAAGIAAVMVSAGPVSAETFKWAFQGDVQSLDPHGLNETFTLGFLGNVYEGLTAYNQKLELEPGLAVSWENTEPTVWRFNLREGVKFHEGGDFTADDVIFTWKRMKTDGSDMKGYAALIKDIKKIDDHTIDVVTPAPDPILPRSLTFVYIMDKEWAEEHNATEATSPKAATTSSTYAAQHGNGTGPFKVTERQPDVKSVFERFEGYWGDPKTNVTKVEFTPIEQAATRVAALISGELDLVYPVPVQDWKRLESADGVEPLTGPEVRTIFLGIDQSRDELLYSSVKGENPFKDIKVRKAFAHAIDLQAIKDKIMRGASTPTALLMAPQVKGFSEELNAPYEYDPDMSKELLAEAGYPDGFEVGMDCPNNRYVNDERICQAVVAMLARIRIKVDLNAQPKSKYFAKVATQNDNDTSFYLLGWTPSTIDAHNPLFNLVHCQTKEAGQFNYGRYCNPEIDKLTAKIAEETDQDKRQQMIDEAYTMLREDYGYFPLHQQPLSWGIRSGLEVAQRADNVLDFRNVVMP